MDNNYRDVRDDLSLKLFVVLSKTHIVIAEKVKNNIESHGLNLSEFAVLELLFHKGEQAIQQIGKRILLSSGSMAYVVDKLEKKKLLVRNRCPKDRRIIFVQIADEGRELIECVFPKHQEEIGLMFDVLADKEKETLIHLLKKLGLSIR